MPIKVNIFREYIGSQDGSKHKKFPNDIIYEEFHFILAYCKESYENGEGSGIFKDVFNIKNIENLKKKKHPNAKVIVSIGGPKDETRFNPKERNEWLSNAKESLTKIINDNKFDGIDINYETILSSTEDFNFCIGGLIKHLKEENVTTITSIAPSEAVNPHYKSLFKALPEDSINWVDYKFYSLPLYHKKDYIDVYKKLSSEDYSSEFLLVGLSTNPKDAGKLSAGLEACKELADANLLQGIFVSDADYSKPAYEVEKIAQDIIAGSNKNA